jgi:hypothetical protein
VGVRDRHADVGERVARRRRRGRRQRDDVGLGQHRGEVAPQRGPHALREEELVRRESLRHHEGQPHVVAHLVSMEIDVEQRVPHRLGSDDHCTRCGTVFQDGQNHLLEPRAVGLESAERFLTRLRYGGICVRPLGLGHRDHRALRAATERLHASGHRELRRVNEQWIARDPALLRPP